MCFAGAGLSHGRGVFKGLHSANAPDSERNTATVLGETQKQAGGPGTRLTYTHIFQEDEPNETQGPFSVLTPVSCDDSHGTGPGLALATAPAHPCRSARGTGAGTLCPTHRPSTSFQSEGMTS